MDLLSFASQIKLFCEVRSELDDYVSEEIVSAVFCFHSITLKSG